MAIKPANIWLASGGFQSDLIGRGCKGNKLANKFVLLSAQKSARRFNLTVMDLDSSTATVAASA